MNPASRLLRRSRGADAVLNHLGGWMAPLGLRLLPTCEFWASGLEKLHGDDSFADIQDRFPSPFNLVPAGVSGQLATWTEPIGPVLLVLGLGTRFASLPLIIVTRVAWIRVHAGKGCNVMDNGWKLPRIRLVMFMPLLLNGAGKLSLDHFIDWRPHRHLARIVRSPWRCPRVGPPAPVALVPSRVPR